MNSLADRNKLGKKQRETNQESRVLSVADEEKLIAGQMQLEVEAEARKRRVKLRKQRQVKLEALQRIKRRKRAVKLAVVWMFLIAGGFFATMWFSSDVFALMAG